MWIARSVIVVAFGTVLAASSACTSGGGGSSGSTGGDGGAGGSSSGSTDDATCLLKTTLSGGVTATLGDVEPACLYSQRSIAFVPLGGDVTVTIRVEDVERNQTGTFPARIDVRANDESWSDAQCSLDIESNELREAANDAGSMFDQYLLRGKGSCTTPATYRGEAGTKEPVTIAPFTFVMTTLFY